MSENSTNLDAMKYNDLKALAKEKGLDASGTKEDLIARLSEAGAGNTAPASGASDEGDNGDEPEAPQKKPAVAATQSNAKPTVEQLHMTKAMRTKALLDKQPKVSVLIPFEAGENPEQGKKIPFHVGINGYSIDIPRGVMVEVPEQVAKMVKERLESEGRIGREWRIDTDAKKSEALS